jgi:hypothetical protein
MSSCSSLLVESCGVCIVTSTIDFDVDGSEYCALSKNAVRNLLNSSSWGLLRFLSSAPFNLFCYVGSIYCTGTIAVHTPVNMVWIGFFGFPYFIATRSIQPITGAFWVI